MADRQRSSFYFLFLGVQFTPGSVSPPLAFREALSLLASSLCSSRLQQEQLHEAGMTCKVGVWGFLASALGSWLPGLCPDRKSVV